MTRSRRTTVDRRLPPRNAKVVRLPTRDTDHSATRLPRAYDASPLGEPLTVRRAGSRTCNLTEPDSSLLPHPRSCPGYAQRDVGIALGSVPLDRRIRRQSMYIGVGLIVLILAIVLLLMLFRARTV